MKAWSVSNRNGEYSQLLFAEKRSEAIMKSDAYQEEGSYIDVRATRAPYADDLENASRKEFMMCLLENDWWHECHICSARVTKNDTSNIASLVDENGRVFCLTHRVKALFQP